MNIMLAVVTERHDRYSQVARRAKERILNHFYRMSFWPRSAACSA